MSTSKDSPTMTPFPLAQLMIVGLCRSSQPFAIASLLPYLPSYLESLSIRTSSVATYQGALLATLGICESTFAITLTRLADRIGRKPVIIGTLVVQLLGNLCLGFCTQAWQAFACVAVVGIANGNVAVMRTIVAEMEMEKKDQARAFGFTPIASAGGTLLGSLSGGVLSGVVLGAGWPRFLPPSCVAAAVFLPGILTALMMLDETGPVQLGYGKIQSQTDPDDSIELDEGLKGDTGDLSSIDEERQALKPSYLNPPPMKLAILRNPFILLNALTALHSVGSDNMLPVLLQSPSSLSPTSPFTFAHGFGATPRFTGLLYSLGCLSAMGVSSFIYPHLAHKHSHNKILLGTLLAYPAIYFAYPLTLLPANKSLGLGLLTMLFLLKGGTFICALQSSMILLSNSVNKENVALAHGVNFTLGGLGRGIGSAVVGGLFEAGFRVGNLGLPFWGLMGASAGVATLGWLTKR